MKGQHSLFSMEHKLAFAMALLRFLRPVDRDGLPDPKGSLSSKIPSRTISLVNKHVKEAMDASSTKKRGPYKR